MPNSFQLQFKIEEIIDVIFENWCNEVHRITIESFQRKTDFLILFRIGNWDEKEYFFKTAISVKPNDERSYKQLLSLVSLLKEFSHQRTLKVSTWYLISQIYLCHLI